MYEIRVALDRWLIQSRLGGFLTVPEVREYASHMEAAHQRWFRFPPAYRLVIDASMSKIQAQDVLATFSAHIAGYPPAEKIGVVCGASLNRFQTLRTLDRRYLRTCDTVHEAQNWALDGAEADDGDFHLVASDGGLRPLASAA